ncbi:restriction endonuclease subunit S [Flavobacterium sp.]|jgi:type I restriction enzyme S subunit|uniref:restriction endonuclease subunit S n=1 Tax=Flavobacterium sp. TaxID=239 RepID=UPI0037BE54D7
MSITQPKLRFSEFKENWEIFLFEDIYSFRTTNSFSRDKLNYESGLVKNIHYGDIHKGFNSSFKVKDENVPFINSDISLDKISSDNYCQNGDLIIADASEDYADIGKTIEIVDTNNENVLAGLHTFLARPDKKSMAVGFGTFLMKSNLINKQIKLIAQGSKVLSISTGRLGKIKTVIPSINEQRKIADFFYLIDKKINQLTKKKELLIKYNKGITQKIFNQNIKFKDDYNNEFPKWEIVKLHTLCDYKNGGSFENYVCSDGQYNLITLNSIDINGKIKKEHKKVSISDNSLKKGDLIMVLSDVAHGNFLGLTDVIPGDDYVLNQRMAALKPIKEINTYYLKTFINYNQKYFKLMGQGSSQLNLSKGDVINFDVKLPVLQEQDKISNFLYAIDMKINQITIQLEKTIAFKKSLLQQMFV